MCPSKNTTEIKFSSPLQKQIQSLKEFHIEIQGKKHASGADITGKLSLYYLPVKLPVWYSTL